MTNRQRTVIATIVYAFKNKDFANSGQYSIHDLSEGSGGGDFVLRRTLREDEIFMEDDLRNFTEASEIISSNHIIRINLRWWGGRRDEKIQLFIYAKDNNREFYGYDHGLQRFEGRHEQYDQVSVRDSEHGWKKFLYRISRS